MERNGKFILLFKAASEEMLEENDPYREELAKRGYVTNNIPVLDFKYKNIPLLKLKLCQPELYSGVIFTSPRCVRAAVNAVENEENLHKGWRELNTFAVGETTARIVKDKLGLDAEGSSAGNGATLAPIILKRKPNKPFLLPCGNLKMDTLENLLAKEGVVTDNVEVYETISHPNLETCLTGTLREITPTYVVYFSPSGIQATYPVLKNSGVDMDQIKWVAIGPTTSAALEKHGLAVHCAAAKPTPASLADAIEAASA